MTSNSNEIVSDASVEKALDFLRDEAGKIGELTTEARKAEHMVKHILALEMKANEGAVSAREMEARASSRYHEALVKDAVAAGALATAKALREAAALKIEIWRTQSANFRSMKIGD